MEPKKKSLTLAAIAEHLGATLDGDGSVEICGVTGIEAAQSNEVTFVSNLRYAPLAKTTQAAAVIVEPAFPILSNTATLRVANPYLAFARLLDCFYAPPRYEPGIHPTAVIDPSASVGTNAHVGAYVVIGPGSTIGSDAVLLPHTVIYPGAQIGNRFFAHAHSIVREFCRIGDDVILQNGAVIGGDGFGYAKSGAQWTKIVQSGVAILEDRVEVQSNSCVDRASIGETRIASGTKVDNLVQVGHGSTVGEDTLLCAQVGLAGSTEIGNRVILAGQVGVAGHCSVGDDSVATAQSGIPNDVSAKTVVSGYPAMDNRQWLRTVAAFARLPELVREVRALKKTVFQESGTDS